MIGGTDLHFPTTAARDRAVEVSVRAVKAHWNESVFENGTTGEKYDHFFQIPFGRVTEIFVYKNPQYSQRWDDEGAIDELSDTMVHIIFTANFLSVVVDSPDSSEVQPIIRGIQQGLQCDIHNIQPLEAA